jgi:hypothetical protein
MGENRGPETDRAIISDFDSLRMHFIEINRLAYPYVLPNFHTSHTMQPDSQGITPRGYVGYSVQEPVE